MMKWDKLGHLFDPTQHKLSQGCDCYAKSPQALVFDDYVRIYFSAQKKTPNGKYVSIPQFVDFDKGLSRMLGLSCEPVIALGNLGEFDEHGIFPFNVLKHEGKVLAFTSGWSRRTSVSIEMSIGLAVSDNGGRSFVKHGSGGPVMAASHNEPFLVGDPFVRHLNGLFHMWYIFGTKWERPTPTAEAERFYHIAHATSSDGIDWKRDGVAIIPKKSVNECQALPTVFFRAGVYHMYFCYRDAFDFRQNRNNAYRLGYAWSHDLVNWTRDDDAGGLDVSAQGWDSDMMCYPNAFECDGEIYMLYNGNEFGKHGFGIARLSNAASD